MENKTVRNKELISICSDNFGNWGEMCKSCPIIEPCKPRLGDTPDKMIERLNQAAGEYFEKANK